MYSIRSLFVFGLAVFTAGCSSTIIDTNPNPKSAIVTLNAESEIPDQGYSDAGIKKNFKFSGNGYGFAYAYGSVAGTDDFLGVAGYRAGDTGNEITTGSVSYDAWYSFARTRGNDTISRDGDVILTAGFETGSGTVTGKDNGLEIDGTFTGSDLNGVVRYDGAEAKLEGKMGDNSIYGAFAGHDESGVLVGGFTGRTR